MSKKIFSKLATLVMCGGVITGVCLLSTTSCNQSTSISISTTDDTTIAYGQSIIFYADVTNPSGTTAWNTTNLPTGVTFVDDGNGTITYQNNLDASYTEPTTFTVYATNNSVTSNSIDVIFDNTPTTTVSISTTDNLTVAYGSTITFSSTVANPSGATVWNTTSLPAGVTFNDNEDGTATYTNNNTSYTTPAPFTVYATNNSVTSNSIAITFSNNPATTISISTTDSTNVTYGSTITFSSTIANPSGATVWNTTNLPAGVTFKDNEDGTVTYDNGDISYTDPTNFTVYATNNSVVSNSIEVTFDNNPATLISINTTDNTTVAYGSTITFTSTLTNPSGATVWNTTNLPAGVTFTDNGDGTATYTNTNTSYTTPATFSVYATNHFATSNAYPVTFNNNPATLISISTNDNPIVAYGSTITFSTNVTNPSGATTWNTTSLPTGVTFTDNGDGTATYTNHNASYTTPAPFSVTATNNSVTSAAIAVTFNNNPATTIVISTQDNTTVAFGSTITFRATLVNPSGATVWNTASLPTGVTFTDNGDGTVTYTNNIPSYTTPAPYSVSAVNNSVMSNAIAITFSYNPATYVSVATTSQNLNVKYDGSITFNYTVYNTSGATTWNTTNLPAGVTSQASGTQIVYSNAMTDTAPATFDVYATNNSVSSDPITITFYPNGATSVSIVNESSSNTIPYGSSTVLTAEVDNPQGDSDLVSLPFTLPSGITATRIDGNHYTITNQLVGATTKTVGFQYTNNGAMSSFLDLTFTPQTPSITIAADNTTLSSTTTTANVTANIINDSNTCTYTITGVYTGGATWTYGNDCQITTTSNSLTIVDQYEVNPSSGNHLYLTITAQTPSGLVSNQIQITLNGISGISA